MLWDEWVQRELSVTVCIMKHQENPQSLVTSNNFVPRSLVEITSKFQNYISTELSLQHILYNPYIKGKTQKRSRVTDIETI